LGGCWVKEEDRQIYPKTKQFSIIASSKSQLPGHQLRHEVIKASGSNIDVYGNGYKTIPYKLEGLKDYRYHFAIENTRAGYWFTEKLIDCLMTGTMPIYWGCSPVSLFFNPDGFILFDSLIDLKAQLKKCTPEYYESKLPAIKENFERAKYFVLAEDYIYNHVLDSASRES
jgi:hypothetical protein